MWVHSAARVDHYGALVQGPGAKSKFTILPWVQRTMSVRKSTFLSTGTNSEISLRVDLPTTDRLVVRSGCPGKIRARFHVRLQAALYNRRFIYLVR